MRTCLCVMFNHAFPENVEVLRQVYAGRFSFVRFFQPLLPSDSDDVWTTYRGSFSHAAYITDYIRELMALEADRYVFIHDDVLLSPAVDEANIGDALGLEAEDAFISHLVRSKIEDIGAWGFWPGTLWRLFSPRNLLSGTGVHSWPAVKAALPPEGELEEKLRRFGLAPTRLRRTSASLDYPMGRVPLFDGVDAESSKALYEKVFELLAPAGEVVPDYPLVNAGPGSDFYVLPRSVLPRFAHVCGVLAAAGAFVEVAVGTAMVCAARGLKLACDADLTFTWARQTLAASDVLAEMQQDRTLFVAHPVKISEQGGVLLDLMRRSQFPVPQGVKGSFLEQAKRLTNTFDPQAYLSANPDVALAGIDPAHHYVAHGWREGRDLGNGRHE